MDNDKILLIIAEVFEWHTIEGESPVREMVLGIIYLFSSRTGHEKPCLNLAGPPAKAKYID